ncbi:helix-turn-helix domain-containing protein [Deinococcus aerophilus]|uniref:PEGA domain-containing protein n=1 Tax=Deinococcus aerophilus TaxID=522488 RepID=A0ABQ2GNY6_9DEIO|nr:helix-turn-helix domain-containing protein [Deinococcus aerophilus]GGM04445.1 hypothetical protein GCM10010841_11030 [Deinococcus aerophilus]
MSFGEILRHTREAQGLTLREVALSTNIRRDYLQALEDEQTELLPERTYARAYLQRYARELNLDPSPLLGAFDRAHLSGTDAALGAADQWPMTLPEDPSATAPSPWDGGRGVIVAVLVALLVLVGGLLYRSRAPASVTLTPSVPTAPVQPDPAPSVAPADPADSPQGAVRLSVRSVPGGARVYLDNRNLGPSPVLAFPVDARSQAELRVEAAGYVPLRQTIALNRSRNLRADLAPSGGSSRLTDLDTGEQILPAPAVP